MRHRSRCSEAGRISSPRRAAIVRRAASTWRWSRRDDAAREQARRRRQHRRSASRAVPRGCGSRSRSCSRWRCSVCCCRASMARAGRPSPAGPSVQPRPAPSAPLARTVQPNPEPARVRRPAGTHEAAPPLRWSSREPHLAAKRQCHEAQAAVLIENTASNRRRRDQACAPFTAGESASSRADTSSREPVAVVAGPWKRLYSAGELTPN